MTWSRFLATGMLLACACGKPPSAPTGARQESPIANQEMPTSASARREVPESEARVEAKPSIADDEDLKVEEREANPYSETVTLKLSVTPPVKAQVTWGGKQMARLAPGAMDAELTRPRGSGPLDLEIKAEGFMPYHTRLYADRNDKISVRLYRVEEAPGLLGYKRSASAIDKGEKKRN